MKLILASSPEGLKDITEKIVELVGKPANEISVCCINEAGAKSKSDKRWFIKGLYKMSKTYGGKIGFCNLLALDIKEVEEMLLEYDVVWCFGGHTDYLKSVFDKTGFSTLLPKLLKKIVWVGSSAGSCVMVNRHTFTPIECGIAKYMGLFDFCLRPHVWEKYATEDKYKYENLVEESHKQIVYALSDKSAVIVDGQKIYLHGKKAQKLKNGKVIEKI